MKCLRFSSRSNRASPAPRSADTRPRLLRLLRVERRCPSASSLVSGPDQGPGQPRRNRRRRGHRRLAHRRDPSVLPVAGCSVRRRGRLPPSPRPAAAVFAFLELRQRPVRKGRDDDLTSNLGFGEWPTCSATRRFHDASLLDRLVRRTLALSTAAWSGDSEICQGIPLASCVPVNHPFRSQSNMT